MWLKYAYKIFSYMPNLEHMFVSGTEWQYYEVDVSVGCILACIWKNVGSVAHLACLLFKVYMQCGSHSFHVRPSYNGMYAQFGWDIFLVHLA